MESQKLVTTPKATITGLIPPLKRERTADVNHVCCFYDTGVTAIGTARPTATCINY